MDRPDAVSTVEVLAYEGFAALDVVGPLEVFRAAASPAGADTSRSAADTAGSEAAPGLDVRVVSLEPSRRVTASRGLTVEPDGRLSAAPDLLVVPGGGWSSGAERGVAGEIDHGALPDAVAERHAAGSTVAAVCTGALLLAAAGLLDGRPATTHRSAREALVARGADVRDARVVDAGDVLTAGGVTAGLDLALHVVGEVAGEERADDVAAAIEYERQGEVLDVTAASR